MNMLSLSSFAVLLSIVAGCYSGEFHITPFTVAADSLFSVTEADIQEAAGATPLLTNPFSIAIYSPTRLRNPLIDSMRTYPYVSKVSVMSPVLIEGDRYFQRDGARYGQLFTVPGYSVKQLRLNAALYRADVLVTCSIFQHLEGTPNILGWILYPLAIPVFFVGGSNYELESQAHVFAFDVRNGFFYTSVVARRSSRRSYETVNFQFSEEADQWREDELALLIPDVSTTLRRDLANSAFYNEIP